MIICTQCHRHHRPEEDACPFCAAPPARVVRTASRWLNHMGIAATTVVLAACYGTGGFGIDRRVETGDTGWDTDVGRDTHPPSDTALSPDGDADGYDRSIDCDDTDPSVHPDASEDCGNNRDDDCDTLIDTLDPTCPDFEAPTEGDQDGDGYQIFTDCDDADPAVHPDAAEDCGNGKDDDCDTLVDTLDPECAGPIDGDGDGFTSEIDCNDEDAAIHPAATEICDDEIDNDCDSLIDADDPACE